MMERSDSIKEIAGALVKFNAEVSRIEKDGTNPHLRNKYATIDQIIDEIRPILSRHGLSIIQIPSGTSEETTIQTMLLHDSGEFLTSPVLSMRPVKSDPQGVGSVITYLRRYSLNAFLSLNTGEDDDGNAGSGTGQAPQSRPAPQQERPEPSTKNTPAEQPRNDSRPSSGTDKPASDSQLNAVKSIGRSKGKNEEWIEGQCEKRFGKGLAQLSRKEASDLIDALRAYNPT